MNIFLKGCLLGFSLAAIVGPIGLLCIRRALTYGFWSGFISGIGAALADASYALIAGFGLTIISQLLLGCQFMLRFGGGLFLCYLGMKTFVAQSTADSSAVTHKNLIGDFVSTFFLTLTSPMTIILFFSVFAGIGVGVLDSLSASLLVGGVFIGSTFWWLLLAAGVFFLSHMMAPRVINVINKFAGAMLIGFGIWGIISYFV